MKTRTFSSCFIIAAFAASSCAVGLEEGPLSDDELGQLGEDDVASSAQPLTKGTIGAVNGDKDYCDNPSAPCVAGEGDCDASAQCTGGSACLPDNGAKFGFPSNWDVCAPSHCKNGLTDGGETTPDCGGPCGTCVSNCAGTPGSASFCVGCLCTSGAGDCDANAECQAGLICAPDNGSKFALPAGYDVCVPPHCANGVLDAGSGETTPDVGGPCGGGDGTCSGTAGSATFCVGCKCTSGQGDCDGAAECASGLRCGVNNGPQFALPAGYDVCVPPHCTNGVLDSGSGETTIDSGGPCGSGSGVPARNVFFSEYAEGTGNSRALEIYNAGAESQTCTINIYYSGATSGGSSIALSAPIAPQGNFVICRSAGTIATPPCNQSSSVLTFTGDDAVELVCGGVTQDIIGQIGVDPGSQWGTGLVSTADNTIRRRCSVTTGDPNGADVFSPSVQWDGFANNDFTNLGTRVCP